MLDLIETAPVQRRAAEVAEKLRSPQTLVWLNGSQGAGRTLVAEELRRLLPKTKLVEIETPHLGSPDAVAHARVQLAVQSSKPQANACSRTASVIGRSNVVNHD